MSEDVILRLLGAFFFQQRHQFLYYDLLKTSEALGNFHDLLTHQIHHDHVGQDLILKENEHSQLRLPNGYDIPS